MSKWVIDSEAADEFTDPLLLEDAWAVAIKKFGGRPLDGSTSDGYHTFQELYDQRSALLMALCNSLVIVLYEAGVDESEFSKMVFKSHTHHDGESIDGYFLVGINCEPELDKPAKWSTWHCEDKWWDANVAPELDRAPEWDGHTPKDALERLIEAFTPVDN